VIHDYSQASQKTSLSFFPQILQLGTSQKSKLLFGQKKSSFHSFKHSISCKPKFIGIYEQSRLTLTKMSNTNVGITKWIPLLQMVVENVLIL
jgi:hypothetical protein